MQEDNALEGRHVLRLWLRRIGMNATEAKRKTISLTDAIGLLMAKHGSLRAAARALDVDAAYLYRLLKGERVNPGPKILRKLRLKRIVTVAYVPEKP